MFPCGQCMPCRINRRRLWMWRQYLESLCHAENSFVTLTYDEDHLPAGGQLRKRDVQLFLKSFRFAIRPLRVRYFLVGEYGEETHRPHYHISLFGVSASSVVNGKPVYVIEGDAVVGRGVVGGWLQECWGRGRVDCRPFNHVTAQYVAGYVVKKLTDRKRGLDFDVPEFSLMSNRPGLGFDAVRTIAEQLRVNKSWKLARDDVPFELRVGGKRVFLGRYLVKKLRELMGSEVDLAVVQALKDEASHATSVELLGLFLDTPNCLSISDAYKHKVAGTIAAVEARQEIYSKRSSL